MTQRLGSATIFSLAADPPSVLLTEPEGHTELDASFLADDSGRYPCSIRKLSAAGAMLHLEAEVPLDHPLCLHLANGQSLAGTLAWAQDSTAGFAFDVPIDVIGTLARTLASLPAERRQMPRVELHQTVSVAQDGKVDFTRSRNISQGGAAIETRRDYKAGDAVQISFDGLRPIDSTVRWARDGQIGVAFDEPLGWQMLMPWLRQVQQTPAHPIRTGVFQEPGLIPDAHAIHLDVPARVREGVRWWNVRIRGLTTLLVEIETRATLAPGTQLWIALPHVGGAPASVIESQRNRYLCEFRLPLRAGDLQLISGTAAA